MNSDDREAAASHALRAWQSAEQLLGDHRLTAILAYNYGHLVLFSDPEIADQAMSRAVELQNAGIADLDHSNLNLYAVYADFRANEFDWKRADQLREILKLRGTDGRGMERTDHVTIWLELASGYLASGRFDDAADSAGSAETLIRAATPEDWHPLAQASLLNAIARLARTPRTLERIQQAHNALVRARQLFPLQKDFEHFDPLLAQILGWNAVADKALSWSGEVDYPDHENLDPNSPHPLPELLISGGDASRCDIPGLSDWDRSAIPSGKLRSLYVNDRLDDYIGGLVVGLHVSEDQVVTQLHVLAEVPRRIFSDYVAEGLEGVRLPAAPDDGPDCSGNLIKAFRLGIEFNPRFMWR